ncbi:MAG: MraY family glycosyltransferase [Acidobacteriota bacterium]
MHPAPLFLAFSALLLALVLTPIFRNLGRKLGWFDLPDQARKLHKEPIPRIGGIPIVLAYTGAFALLLLVPLPGRDLVLARGLPLAWNLIPAALVVFATGLADDLAGLQPWQKFAGQFAAAGLACWAGIRIDSIGPHAIPLWLAIPVTLLWLAACSNAFNLIDGIDGLAAGIGLLAAAGTLIAALLTGHTGLVLATAPLAGALLGFLLFNFSPASVFPGDSGSLSIGFLLGCFAIIWSHKAATLFGMAAPLMVLSIPLADTALAIGRRILRRQPVFRGDRAHIHHKLLDRGLAPRRVALVLYGIAGIGAAFSIVQSVAEKKIAAALLVLFCAAAWLAVQHLGYAEFGIAGRLMLPSTFFRLFRSELRLRALEDELARASGPGECWDAIRAASRDFGFARLVLRMDGMGVREEWLRDTASPANCWMLRVPLSHSGYVNIGCEFSSRVEPMILARFAAVLHTLEPKLPAARPEAGYDRPRVRVASLAGLLLLVIAAHAAGR